MTDLEDAFQRSASNAGACLSAAELALARGTVDMVLPLGTGWLPAGASTLTRFSVNSAYPDIEVESLFAQGIGR